MAKEMSELTERWRATLTPLTDVEERRAIEVALASWTHRLEDPVVRGVELGVTKPRHRHEPPSRRVRVVVTERGGARAHETVLDPDGAIIEERDLGPMNLPYTSEEIEQARDVAGRDEHVAGRLVGRAVGVGTFGPSLGDSGHRLVGLHFLDVTDQESPRPIVSVVVDLATGAVVPEPSHHEDPRESGGH